MEIRIIEGVNRINIENEPFELFGRMIPMYDGYKWSYIEELKDDKDCSMMCFPQENYNPSESKSTFLGAFDNDKCVGLAVLDDYWFKYMYINDLKVCDSYRRRGIGKLLIDKSMEIAKEKGYKGLYVVGQDNNLAACRFYIKNGFEIGGFDNKVYEGTSQEGKADITFYKKWND